jgi:DNA-binding FadR family transcriptional regulator
LTSLQKFDKIRKVVVQLYCSTHLKRFPMLKNFQTQLVDRRRLYQQIADDVERLILDGTFPPESRLPSEQELATKYGVSRNVIREALKSLKEIGLVSIHTGSGTYVRRPTMKPVAEALNRFVRHSLPEFSLTHFYELRRMVEPDSASLAAQRAEEEDIAAILATLRMMDMNKDDLEAWSCADLEFHRTIAAATHNPLIRSLIDALIDPLRVVIAAGHAEPFGTQAGLEAHSRIASAIQTHDSETAFSAMLEHLNDSESRIAKLSPAQAKKEATS